MSAGEAPGPRFGADPGLTRLRDPGTALWLAAGLAWVVAIGLTLTSLGGAAHHEAVLAGGAGSQALQVLGFVVVWQVMVVAMMLPTTVPMVRRFWAVTARSAYRRGSRTLFLGAYLALWTGFGVLALVGDAQVHALVDRWHWLHERPALLLGAVLVFAGAYQLSRLKTVCLTACRSPASLLWRHYRAGRSGGLRVGLVHAGYCVGCCWALMLVMFASGVASLAWMLVLAPVMLIEKVTSWGQRVVVPVGVALLAGGAGVAAVAVAG